MDCRLSTFPSGSTAVKPSLPPVDVAWRRHLPGLYHPDPMRHGQRYARRSRRSRWCYGAREPHSGRRSCCCTSSHPSRCRSGRSRGGRLVVGVVASWRRCVGRSRSRAAIRADDDAVVEGAGCRAGSRWAGCVRREKLPPTPFTVFCLRSNVGVGLTADLLPEHTEERISRCWGGCQGISSPADRACSY